MRQQFPSLARAPRRAQRGISLIVAMVMLVVIGLASVAVIRNTTSVDRAVTNNRLQAQANQFAQMALRFCENQVLASNSGKTVVSGFAIQDAGAWVTKNNWVGGAPLAYNLKDGDIPTGAVRPAHMPACLAEKTAKPNIWTVTSRGFSDDWAENSSNATTNGSVVWLQSTITM